MHSFVCACNNASAGFDGIVEYHFFTLRVGVAPVVVVPHVTNLVLVSFLRVRTPSVIGEDGERAILCKDLFFIACTTMRRVL